MKKYNFLWIASSISLFVIFYIICRFITFDIHQMKEGPLIVALAGIIILPITYIFKLNFTTITATLGYIIAYIIGVIFNTNGVDPSGGTTNNLWIIWIISYWIFIGLGILIDIIFKYKTKNKLKGEI